MQAYCQVTLFYAMAEICSITQYNGVRYVENLSAVLDLPYSKLHQQFLCKCFFELIQDPKCCALPENLNCPSRNTCERRSLIKGHWKAGEANIRISKVLNEFICSN
jgi:hypothetical protein